MINYLRFSCLVVVINLAIFIAPSFVLGQAVAGNSGTGLNIQGKVYGGGTGKISLSKISQVKPGMSVDQVVKIIGQPISISQTQDTINFYYDGQDKQSYEIIIKSDLEVKEIKRK